MLDDMISRLYKKSIKPFFKKNKKFIITIILYFLYQMNFIYSLLYSFGLNINSISRTPRIILMAFCDLLYILVLILMFRKEIKKGLVDLKNNFVNRVSISVTCWLIGSVIMTVSSILLTVLLKQDTSTNEALVRESIKLAPVYMLYTCCFIAPIFEEMVFRVSLYGLIKNKWIFIISSGFIFGLFHVLGSYKTPLDFLYIIPYGSMGCCFAYLLSKTKNMNLSIFIHMIHNTILVVAQIIGG